MQPVRGSNAACEHQKNLNFEGLVLQSLLFNSLQKIAITQAQFCFDSVSNFGNWCDMKFAKPKRPEMKQFLTAIEPTLLIKYIYF